MRDLAVCGSVELARCRAAGNAEVADWALPNSLTREGQAWLRRPGRRRGSSGAIAVVVASTCLVAGGVRSPARRADIRAGRYSDRSEPLAYSAQKLYAALSAADSSAATAFLSAGIETTQMRARYRQAIADAASALADTTAEPPDRNTRTALAQLSSNWPTTRAGRVGGCQQPAEVRGRFLVLPRGVVVDANGDAAGCQKVYDDNLAALDEDQRAVGSTPLAALMLVGIAIVANRFRLGDPRRPYEPSVQSGSGDRGRRDGAGAHVDGCRHVAGGDQDRTKPQCGNRDAGPPRKRPNRGREGAHARPWNRSPVLTSRPARRHSPGTSRN